MIRSYARVIPSPLVIQMAIENGITMDHLIATKSPFTETLNNDMFESLAIEVLITKESGQADAFDELMI